MTTRAELRASLRIRLDEPVQINWSDADLNDFIAEGIRELGRRAMFCETTTSWAATVGKYQYVKADHNLVSVIQINRLTYQATGDTRLYPLEHRAYQNMDAIWWTESGTQSTPDYFMVWGVAPDLNIQLYPVPSRAGTLKLWYWSYPTVPANDSTALNVPAGWEDLVMTYAHYCALLRDGDQRWQQIWAKFDSDVGLMKMNSQSHSIHGDTVIGADGGGNGLPGWLTSPTGDW